MSEQFGPWISEYAYSLLARRDYAVKELRAKVELAASRHFGELSSPQVDELDSLLTLLQERRHLSEERFVLSWIENRITVKPRGRFMILQELLAHGVDRDLAERLLRSELLPALEQSMAARLAAKKMRSQADTRKITSYLAAKGFSYECIRRVLAAAGTKDDTPEDI